jgi:hypothetical protein
MLLACHRVKSITPEIPVFLPDLDGCLGTAGARPFLHAEKRFAIDKTALVHQGK